MVGECKQGNLVQYCVAYIFRWKRKIKREVQKQRKPAVFPPFIEYSYRKGKLFFYKNKQKLKKYAHQYCPKYFVKNKRESQFFQLKISLRRYTAKDFGTVFVASAFARAFVPGYRRYALCCLPGRETMNLQPPPYLFCSYSLSHDVRIALSQI